jgi:phosphoserine phosphatase RsbU/P
MRKVSMLAEVESLRKSLNIYKGLVEVSGLINSIADYNELLRAILDVARRVILAEAASLFFVNEETGALELAITSFAEGQFTEPRISVPRGKGIAGWVVTHGESLLIPNAYADDRFYKEADQQTGFRTRSILCAPLKHNGQVIGVLQILNPRDKESFDEQELEGFTAYANLTATAIEKLRTLERMRAQERVERDLAIASDIQRELLARAIPQSVPGAVFAAHNKAASNVGGDFYNVFVRSPYETYFAIGDVSGKGISASLLMAQTLSAMQLVFATTTSPSDALARLNSTLSERIVRGMFVTTIVGRIVPSANRIELASAGHCKPVMLRADGSAFEIETDGSLPLGILAKVAYRQGKIDIHPGDWFICYTDGLSESKDSADEVFEQKIVSSLAGRKFESPRMIVDHLIERERVHRGGRRQNDDLTILAGGLA